MLNTSPGGSPAQDQHAGASPSPERQLSSPGTDLESQEPSQNSPGAHAPLDQPAGIDSDDNFEVSDDADEQQVHGLSWRLDAFCSSLVAPDRQHLQALHLTVSSCVSGMQQQLYTHHYQ